MSVYVDGLADRGWHLGPNAHMIADSLDELHAMARRIGMRRSWFQPTSFPHYDLTAKRRAAALRAGAVELDKYAFVATMRRLRNNAGVPYGEPP